MPPHIERKSYQLTVDIYEARKLKPVDGKTCDAYVGVEFGRIFEVTKTRAKTVNPEYKERVLVPVHLPAIIDNIILRVIDCNIIQAKEILGSYYLNINRLINETMTRDNERRRGSLSNITSTQWINLYGPQLEAAETDLKGKYQLYPDDAPAYVGSLLIKATMEENSNPRKDKQDILSKEYKPPLVYY